MTNVKYNDGIKSAVWVFERLEAHARQHGKPVKNDPELWREVDFASADAELSQHWILNLQSLAKFNTHWDHGMAQWCAEVLERKPVHLRQRGDKWTTNNNNVMIWRLMMLFREVVNQELDMMALNTFHDHFE